MPSTVLTTVLVISFLLVLLPEAHAFGAGDIPDFSYLNGKAFRHGDIENTLLELIKSAGHAGGGESGILGLASSLLGAASSGFGGAKFTKEDVKWIYFGNWLRDYSQAMDIAGLSKLSADTLVLIVSVLGFLTFGFATEEFQVTADRLGVYLPVEHIDNPKGYAEKEGDARRFHPKLRPPVNPRELEFDERTGMKNYMATEGRGWDTSTAFIRRTFQACIEHGRRSRGKEGLELFEAYRLLGQGLHTLEDFTAHSNWCEIALRKLGHEQVFCHVGDRVIINSPRGPCPPIVTGTFGGADFLHSLMGEATDHISQSSVTALSTKMQHADDSSMETLKSILKQFRGSGNDDNAQIHQAEEFKAKSKAYHFNPNNVMPKEVQTQLFSLLKWHDDIIREITEKLELVPGLVALVDKLSEALNTYVYTVIAPYVTPLLSQVAAVLSDGSKEVIDSADQYEVFTHPNASDPSHSLLSKDHFQIILNEPAGKVAQVVVRNAVNHIVQAWSNNEDPNRVIDQILEAFHHPYYASGRSQVQNAMLNTMEEWLRSLGNERQETLHALTKESVRAGNNKRQGSENDSTRGSIHQNYARSEVQTGVQGFGYLEEHSKKDDFSGSLRQDPGYGRGRQEPPYGSRVEAQPHGANEEFLYGGGGAHFKQEIRHEEFQQGRNEYRQPGYGRLGEEVTHHISDHKEPSPYVPGGHGSERYERQETSTYAPSYQQPSAYTAAHPSGGYGSGSYVQPSYEAPRYEGYKTEVHAYGEHRKQEEHDEHKKHKRREGSGERDRSRERHHGDKHKHGEHERREYERPEHHEYDRQKHGEHHGRREEETLGFERLNLERNEYREREGERRFVEPIREREGEWGRREERGFGFVEPIRERVGEWGRREEPRFEPPIRGREYGEFREREFEREERAEGFERQREYEREERAEEFEREREYERDEDFF